MASTISVANTISWASPFVMFKPLSPGVGDEPALTNANIVMQTILGPPFAWRWNRNTTTITTVQGTQDYAVAVADFGFIENISVASAAGTFEIENKQVLGLASEQARPHDIAAQSDDGSGNITFRFLPVPDGAYTVTVAYQKKAPLFTSLASNWAPIPDEYSYIFNHGFLALCMMFTDDVRFQVESQRFVTHLLGASEGLSQMQRNIFVGNWLSFTNQIEAAGIRTQQGAQARGA